MQLRVFPDLRTHNPHPGEPTRCLVFTCTGQAAPSPRAQMVCPSICLLISQIMSISASLALPRTKRHIMSFIQSTPTRENSHHKHTSSVNGNVCMDMVRGFLRHKIAMHWQYELFTSNITVVVQRVLKPVWQVYRFQQKQFYPYPLCTVCTDHSSHACRTQSGGQWLWWCQSAMTRGFILSHRKIVTHLYCPNVKTKPCTNSF